MKVIILTGDEIRHQYFRKKLTLHPEIKVLASYCEGTEKSLENITFQNQDSSELERQHVNARTQSEHDFFNFANSFIEDTTEPVTIKKNDINNDKIVSEIESNNPDLLVCYGSSLIKSTLLTTYKDRFLNVHLGLSPYYRGSGTNVWPLINWEPYMVGATYMHIDAGIDTGEIIHQIRPDIFVGDNPHTIGNRLIKKMTEVYCEIICSFRNLTKETQPIADEGHFYLEKDFDTKACERLYDNFSKGMIDQYLTNTNEDSFPYIVTNKGLRKG